MMNSTLVVPVTDEVSWFKESGYKEESLCRKLPLVEHHELGGSVQLRKTGGTREGAIFFIGPPGTGSNARSPALQIRHFGSGSSGDSSFLRQVSVESLCVRQSLNNVFREIYIYIYIYMMIECVEGIVG